jgi:hypothetical protein
MNKPTTKHTLYRVADGAIISTLEVSTADAAAANTPAGYALLDGHFRSDVYRVVNGAAVDYVPPTPGPLYAWNATAKTWSLTAAAATAAATKAAALASIAALEAKQHRAVREHILGDSTALERVQAIDTQIAALRPNL